MSYERLQSVLIDTENEKIIVRSACSNSDRWNYETYEYGKDMISMEDKLTRLLVSCISGCYKPTSDCSIYGMYSRCNITLKKVLNTEKTPWYSSFWEKDYEAKTSYYNRIEEMVCRNAAKKYLTGKGMYKTADYENVVNEAYKKWEEIDRERAENGIVVIKTASSLIRKFDGYDCLVAKDGTIYIAKQENYNNRGLLNNKDKSAIAINGNEDTFMDFHVRLTREQLLEKYPQLKAIA